MAGGASRKPSGTRARQPAAPPRSSRRRDVLLAATLLLATLVAYRPAWHGQPVWDDDGHLTPAALQSADGLRRIWLEPGATQQYYPVVHTAFWVFARVAGHETTLYHVANIVLHAASAFLIVVMLRRLHVPGAMLAGALFALHPVHVESVAWMSELKNTLSGVVCLGAAICYLDYEEKRHRGAYVAALALFVVAVLSKSTTAMLPVALAIVVWWKRDALWARDLRPLVPFVVVGLAAGLMTAWVERTFIGANSTDFQISLPERLIIAGRAVWFYAGSLVWPANLVFTYPRWALDAASVAQYAWTIGAVGIAILFWRLRRQTKAPFAVLALFVALLFPALGFVDVYPFRYSFVADHFQYLASIPLLAGIAALLGAAHSRLPARTARVSVALALIAVLGVLTWRQSRMYASADTLYRETLRRNPSSWMAHTNLGAMALAPGGDLTAAITHLERARALNPSNAEARNNLGIAYQRTGRFAEAKAEHDAALRLNPRLAAAHNNLGVDLLGLGQPSAAAAAFRDAVRLNPADGEAWRNLGTTFTQLGQFDHALAALGEALRVAPCAEAFDAKGTALQRAGRVLEAVDAYREAVRLAPQSAEMRNNLGTALVRLERYDEALPIFTEALARNPEGARIHDNLGDVLMRLGRPADAEAHFRDARRLDPGYGPAAYHLGNALQELGRLPDAIDSYRAALGMELGDLAAFAHNDLGVALARLGHRAEAAREFRAALLLVPSFTEAQRNLATVGR